MLIWAGSVLYDNRNVFDFKPNYSPEGEPYLSMIVNFDIENNSDKGTGVTVNKHYEQQSQLRPDESISNFNMHEFNILDGGKTALTCVYTEKLVNLADFGRPTEDSYVVSGDFAEYDLTTNEILAQWSSTEHIALHESNLFHNFDAAHPSKPGWDYVHINAVDKNAAGDYIASLRFTDTIYGISGVDGNIMWRLGGLESDFAQDFTFTKQHDVKFVSSEGTKHVISFLNNASDERANEENVSSVLHVELDTETMVARVVKRVSRPDGGLTRLRGSAQTLPSGNIFAGWSEYGYQSEHSPEGDVLMTAKFASERYSTYRAYKGEWVGRPLTPPDVVASVYGASTVDITTIIHVSWNGATDVAGWNFYAQSYDKGDPVLIGYAAKTDFETMYIVDGYMDWITAEAVDVNGNEMMKSEVQRSIVPTNWKAVGFQGDSSPSPDDPFLISSTRRPQPGTTGPTSNDTGLAADSKASTDYSDNAFADAKDVAKAVYKAYEVMRGVGGFLLLVLMACTIAGVGFAIKRFIEGRKNRAYQHVSSEEDVPTEEIHLRSQRPE